MIDLFGPQRKDINGMATLQSGVVVNDLSTVDRSCLPSWQMINLRGTNSMTGQFVVSHPVSPPTRGLYSVELHAWSAVISDRSLTLRRPHVVTRSHE